MIRIHKYIIHFIVLVLLQTLIINNIQVSNYFNPFIYILFLIILPIDINKSLLLLLGFITGISIDVFSNTLGLHASACVFLAYLRPHILNAITNKDDHEPGVSPGIKINGYAWFIKYLLFTTLAHHIFLFMVEVFTFSNFTDTLIRILASSAVSVIAIFFYYILGLNRSN